MRFLTASLALVVAVTLSSPATGRAAAPAVEIAISGAGYQRIVTVHVTRGGNAVRDAEVVVSATMRHPGHEMVVSARAARQVRPGVYRASLSFLMLGRWRVTALVDGRRHVVAVRL